MKRARIHVGRKSWPKDGKWYRIRGPRRWLRLNMTVKSNIRRWEGGEQ